MWPMPRLHKELCWFLLLKAGQPTSGPALGYVTTSKNVKPQIQDLRDLQHWKPLPDKWWRHNRLKRLSMCYDEMQCVWISDSVIVVNKSNYQSLDQWFGLALPKGPNRVGTFVTSPEDGNRSSFWNDVFSNYLEFRTMDKVQKLSSSDCFYTTVRTL
jgi:hypothetical protein